MSNSLIVLLGDINRRAVDRVATEFGWSVANIETLERLQQVSAARDVVAVLFEPHTFALSWPEALKSVIDASPAALPIVCHRISEVIDWPDLAAAGAFHMVPLPIHEGEIRQSLSFVSSAKQRTAETIELAAQAACAGELVA